MIFLNLGTSHIVVFLIMCLHHKRENQLEGCFQSRSKLRWWRNWLPGELYTIKLMIYLSAKTCGHQNIFQVPSRPWWNSVRHWAERTMTFQVVILHESVCHHNTSHPLGCHHTFLWLSINPWCQMLMSEQSFCDRKLFIVSLLASLNPHYYESV